MHEASVVILAVPSPTTEGAIVDVATSLGPVTGKLVIDATNPGTFGPTGFRLATAANGGSFRSAGEVIARALPDASVVKAFNTLGFAHMANPSAHGKRVQMLWAGPHDPTAEKVVHGAFSSAGVGGAAGAAECLVPGRDHPQPPFTPHSDVGFDPVYAGPIAASANLEAMAELWINASYVNKVAPLAGGKWVYGVTTTD